MTFDHFKLFSGNATLALAGEICRFLGCDLGEASIRTFADGEIHIQIQENVRGSDVFVVQPTCTPVDTHLMELLMMIDALKRASAQNVTAVIPFFSYAKGDKKDEPRVSIRARVCADAIEAAGADRVLTMDLHSPQIQGFFGIPVDHLFARNVICRHVKSLNLSDLVVCSPDIGFAKDASAYAQLLGVSVVIGNKERKDHTETAEVLELIGDVKGKNVLMVDDFTITGGSLISMAELLKSRGAEEIYAAVSHGVLSKGAAARVYDSPIKQLFITDTIETQRDPMPEKVTVISVANLFAKAIRSIHDRSSVSMLFPDTRPPK